MSKSWRTASIALLVLVLICGAYFIGQYKSFSENTRHAAHCLLKYGRYQKLAKKEMYHLCMIERGVDTPQADRFAKELGYTLVIDSVLE